MKTRITFRISIVALCLCILLSPALIYAQGTWSTLSTDGYTPRFNAISSVVGGKIYVMGGSGAHPGYIFLYSLEVFDLLTNTWSTSATTGIFTARAALSSVAVDNMIYVMGGGATCSFDSPTRTNIMEVFNTLPRHGNG